MVYVIGVSLVSRLMWSLASKQLVVSKVTGALVTEPADYEEISQQFREATAADYDSDSDSDSDDEVYRSDDARLDEFENYRIRIGMLPRCVQRVWRRTKAPVFGVALQTAVSMVLCAASGDVEAWSEFLAFMLLLEVLLVVCSFLIL